MKFTKKTVSLFIFSLCLYLIGCVGTEASAFVGGGTESNPYLIRSVEELYSISPNTTEHFKLTQDLDLKYSKKSPLPEFRGTFDGDGYTIKNINISSGSNNAGLFSVLRDAEVKNLNLTNCTIYANTTHVGMIAGQSIKSTLTNIQVTNADVTGGTATGGICGFANSESLIDTCNVKDSIIIGLSNQCGGIVANLASTSTVRNSSLVNSKVKGTRFTGGIVGYFSNRSLIANSFVKNSLVFGHYEVGGLAGYSLNDGGSITQSHVDATVSGNSYLGGFIGSTDGNILITECSMKGIVNGLDYVGGFIGHNNATVNIENSYTLCEVISTNRVAAFGGYGYPLNISKCYFAGGLTGTQRFISPSASVISDSYFDKTLAGITLPVNQARTTEELYERSNYTSWNFNSIWSIEDNSYPTLQSEMIFDER